MTMEKVIEIATNEVGYVEKDDDKHLYDKNDYAGVKNYTKYAKELYPSLQGQPWCDMFVDWCFVQAYGREKAKKILGGFSAYTPTSAQYFKDMGRYSKFPEKGAIIFFKNSTRINHTGIVIGCGDSIIITIEGNTISGSSVVANGGEVAKKLYNLSDIKSRIDGYGIPDYGYYPIGWNHDENGWFYCTEPDKWYANQWQVINHHKYYFNADGYAVTDWNFIDGNWYYFEPRAGHPKECAMYTATDGKQRIADF